MPSENTAFDVRVNAEHRWQVRSAKNQWIQAVRVSVWQSRWTMVFSDPKDFLEFDKQIRSDIPTLPPLSKSGLSSTNRASQLTAYLESALKSAPELTQRFLDVHNLGRYVHDGNELAIQHFKEEIVNWRDDADGTLLHYAAGSDKFVNFIGSLSTTNSRDRYGLLPSNVTVMCGNQSLAEQLDNNTDPIHSEFSEISVPLQYRKASGARCPLVLVNPISGKGNAMNIFQSVVAPVLDSAEIKYEFKETIRYGDATEIALTFDISRFDTIICVSGDGILHEVIQGLSQRQQRGCAGGFQRFPVCIVPAGSGNAVVCSQSGPKAGPLDVMKKFLKGCYCPADLIEILPCETPTPDTKSIFAIVSVCWGFLSDIDFESEPMRFCGSLRFTVMSVIRLLIRKTYICDISYRDSESEEFTRVTGHLDFFMASNVPFIASDAQIAPSAKIDDGKIHICLSQGKSRFSLLSMLACDVEKGNHVNRSGVKYITCREVIIEPVTNNSILDIDGERCQQKTAHCIMRPASASIVA